MGCLHSKRETSDLHPNVFRVVNVDEHGEYLCSGQLEITENDLILYREGRDSTVWPLHSLRRYGFEEGMFSFESGRRCETGEGIYAFKCRRASLLFRTLQHQILLKNVMNVHPVSRLTPSPQGRQTLQASVVHRSSIDNGQPNNIRPVINNNLPNIISDVVPRNITQSPRSPSSADILEVMPLYPRPQNTSNQVTNVYQFRDFKREHNNNQNETAHVDTHHVYTNDLNRDLAILRNTLRQETALNTMRDIEDETRFLEGRYINENVANNKTNNNLLSPTPSTASEHYAQLSLEQQQQQHLFEQQQQQPALQQEQNVAQQQPSQQPETARLYMNIVPSEANVPETYKNDPVPTTPLTPKPLEYSNLTISRTEINTYANISLGELGDAAKNVKQILSLTTPFEYSQKYSEFDTFPSMSPVEEIEVNYAVLDIDSNKEIFKKQIEVKESVACVSQPHGRLVTQSSVDKLGTVKSTAAAPSAAIGYTTIDFDKTVALTSVASGEEVLPDADGSTGARKTRHNSCNVTCGSGSPANNDKNKSHN